MASIYIVPCSFNSPTRKRATPDRVYGGAAIKPFAFTCPQFRVMTMYTTVYQLS